MYDCLFFRTINHRKQKCPPHVLSPSIHRIPRSLTQHHIRHCKLAPIGQADFPISLFNFIPFSTLTLSFFLSLSRWCDLLDLSLSSFPKGKNLAHIFLPPNDTHNVCSRRKLVFPCFQKILIQIGWFSPNFPSTAKPPLWGSLRPR